MTVNFGFGPSFKVRAGLRVEWDYVYTKSSIGIFLSKFCMKHVWGFFHLFSKTTISAIYLCWGPHSYLRFGWQVCLTNKAAIHSGIVCLNPKVVTVIGGVVPSLYDEWRMNKKYSRFSRSSLRLSKESDGTGPPPFEKLQIGVSRHPVVRQGKYYYHGSRAFI